MVNNRRNHYRVLYVQPDAPFEVIRANYRTLMQKLKLHPDLGGEHWNAIFVNEAYETLADPIKRHAYDLELLKRYDIGTVSRGSLPPTGQKRQARLSNQPIVNQRNFYRILEVQADSPLELIEASYRALAAKGAIPLAQLDEALATLSDPDRRQLYDRELKAGGHLKAIARISSYLVRKTDTELADPVERPAWSHHSGYEPLIRRYCLFCKTPHFANPSLLEEAGCTDCGSPLFAPPADFLVQARRALGRSQLDEDLTFYAFWPGKRFRGRAVDLSPVGLRLLTGRVCEVGELLKIDGQRFQAVGEVVHSRREGVLTTAGIKFHTVAFHTSRGSFLSTRA
jgi:curved DNA-binding protein CbpA